jgi:hypothetical protein
VVWDVVIDQAFVFRVLLGVGVLILALAALELVRTWLLVSRGFYRVQRFSHHPWSLRHAPLREGLTLLAVGGTVAYGIQAQLGFWVTAFLVVAAVGLVKVLTGAVVRIHS